MPASMRTTQQSDAVYQRAWAAHQDRGGYVVSPFTPWSRDDMAWEIAMDDASGNYPPTQMEREVQASLDL